MSVYIKKIILLNIFLILFLNFVSTLDFQAVDDLYFKGKYAEGLKLLQTKIKDNSGDIAFLWRISRFIFEIADAMPSNKKQEKIKEFSKGMDVVLPYLSLNNNNVNNEDKAQLVFWYTANFGSRGEVIGIKESLDIVPELFRLADKALEFDTSFAPAYLLKARIDMAVPFFLGGDKYRMGINLNNAIKYNPSELSILADAAKGFYERNWDVEKKKKMQEKNKDIEGSPMNKTDKEYAKFLLDKAVLIFKDLKEPSARDKREYNKILKLIEKY